MDGYKIATIVLLSVFIIGGGIWAGVAWGNGRYEDGKVTGYNSGYEVGKDAGYEDGYSKGVEAEKSQCKLALDQKDENWRTTLAGEKKQLNDNWEARLKAEKQTSFNSGLAACQETLTTYQNEFKNAYWQYRNCWYSWYQQNQQPGWPAPPQCNCWCYPYQDCWCP
jgi:hypothetical protein